MGASFSAVVSLFVVGFLGWISVRRQWINDGGVTALAWLVVHIIVPAKLTDAMIKAFNPEALRDSGVIILAMVTWTLGGLLIGYLVTRVWRGKPAADRSLWCLCGFQNGFYIPLPLALAILPPELEPRGVILIGAAVLVLSSTQWTIGVWLLMGDEARAKQTESIQASIRGAFSPPVLGILLGACLSFVPELANAARGMQAPFWAAIPVGAASLVGSAMAPMAMLMLGMLIGQCHLRSNLNPRALIVPGFVRLILSPAIMFLFLWKGPLAWASPLTATILMIQASSPSATNLSVAARKYGGDWELVSSVLLVTYLVSMVTMPIWCAAAMAHLK